jgi:hypothetical protein
VKSGCSEFRDLDETLVLESIGCAIPLREIYAKVKLAGATPTGD